MNPGKILLVEDNPDDVTLTMRALKSHNITNDVVVAQDGVQALDYLFGAQGRSPSADLPAVVLLDGRQIGRRGPALRTEIGRAHV